MDNIIIVTGETPEQVVTRALAACQCSEPEGHAALAPELLTRVMPNGGDPAMGAYVLVLPVQSGSMDETAEGVMPLTAVAEYPVGKA